MSGWYDCGKLETLLETNEILLRKGAARRDEFPGVTFHDPVLIQSGVTLERSSIGPNVTIETGSVVRDSRLAHTIVGSDCTLIHAELSRSMLGSNVEIRDFRGNASLADHSELAGGR